MGCRVIFSCLKELADRLHVVHPAPAVDEEQDHPQDKNEQSQSQSKAGADRMDEEEPIETASPVCYMNLDSDHMPVPSKAASKDSVPSATPTATPQPRPVASSFMSSIGNIGATMSNMSGMSSFSTNKETKEKKVEEKPINLLPRELKGLVSDVVLLGAPLQLRVSRFVYLGVFFSLSLFVVLMRGIDAVLERHCAWSAQH